MVTIFSAIKWVFISQIVALIFIIKFVNFSIAILIVRIVIFLFLKFELNFILLITSISALWITWFVRQFLMDYFEETSTLLFLDLYRLSLISIFIVFVFFFEFKRFLNMLTSPFLFDLLSKIMINIWECQFFSAALNWFYFTEFIFNNNRIGMTLIIMIKVQCSIWIRWPKIVVMTMNLFNLFFAVTAWWFTIARWIRTIWAARIV